MASKWQNCHWDPRWHVSKVCVYPWDLKIIRESCLLSRLEKRGPESSVCGLRGVSCSELRLLQESKVVAFWNKPLVTDYSKVWAVAEVFSPHFEQQGTQRNGCDYGELAGWVTVGQHWMTALCSPSHLPSLRRCYPLKNSECWL